VVFKNYSFPEFEAITRRGSKYEIPVIISSGIPS
jgi:hypothetical protein